MLYIEQILANRFRQLILVLLCCSTMPIHAADNPPKKKLIFGITPSEREYLFHIQIRNSFKESLIHYILGELELHSYEKSEFLTWNVDMKVGVSLRGDSTQGVNTNLLQSCQSKEFLVPKNGEISFFRSLNIYVNAHQDVDVLDKTELVFALAESGTHQILAVLDSVGVESVLTLPTKDPNKLLYGTEPRVAVRRIKLPAFTEGKKCYLQLIPKRYGPTPFGLAYRSEKANYNLSAGYAPDGTFTSLEVFKALDDQYYKHLCEYLDAYVQKEGRLPTEIPSYPQKFRDDFRSRYFQGIEWEKIEVSGKEGNKKIYRPKLTKEAKDASSVTVEISPNPVGNLCILALTSLAEQSSAIILLASTDGNSKKLPLWSGSLQKGKNEISIEIPQTIPNGTYMIGVEDAASRLLGTGKIVLMR